VAQLFSIKYGDRHAAALVYRKLSESAKEIGVIAHGLEIIKTDSKKLRKNLKILLVLEKEKSGNLPAVLRAIQHSLDEHPLYEHLNFDYTAFPLSQTQWNFASYDDENYQTNFIRKRAKG
jgi:hypothetical protein